METLETIEMTNPTANPKVVANVGLVIGTNTELAVVALDEKLIKTNDSLLFPPKFYLSSEVNDEAIEVIGKYRNKHSDWLFVGITLQNHLTESGELKKFVPGVKIPNEPIRIGDCFPDVILHDLNKELVDVKEPKDKMKLIIIDSRESGFKVGPWVESISRKYYNSENIAIHQIAAVQKLRFFVSKDFILKHIKDECRGGNKFIDWDSKFTGLLGVKNLSDPILIIINKDNVVKEIISLPQYTLEESMKIDSKIESNLLVRGI